VSAYKISTVEHSWMIEEINKAHAEFLNPKVFISQIKEKEGSYNKWIESLDNFSMILLGLSLILLTIFATYNFNLNNLSNI